MVVAFTRLDKMQKQVTDLNIFVTLSNLQFPNLGMCVNRSIMMGEREIESEWGKERERE